MTRPTYRVQTPAGKTLTTCSWLSSARTWAQIAVTRKEGTEVVVVSSDGRNLGSYIGTRTSCIAMGG